MQLQEDGCSYAKRKMESLVDDDKDYWEMLLERVRARTVVPFLGAGLSFNTLPLWGPLIEDVSRSVGLQDDTDLSNDVKTEAIRAKLYGYSESEPREIIIKGDPLADQFAKAFRKSMKKQNEEAWFDSFVLGSNRHPEICSPNIRESTVGHRAVSTGPWPIILTTNWDTMLEAGYRMIDDDDKQSSDVWNETHPSSSFFKLRKAGLPVRFRKDTQQVYAELRAGIRPPRLLKLHGDFTHKGVGELVAGHADYRRLMIRDVGFSRLMQHICSNYHLLFYGCSLTDRDVLAILDGMSESLGSAIGPHFWLTTKAVSDLHRTFLEKQYSVHAVRAQNYDSAKELLKELCNSGWTLPKPLVYKGLDYEITKDVTVRIEHGWLRDVAKKSMETKSNTSFAVAVSTFLGGRTDNGFCVKDSRLLRDVVDLGLLTPEKIKSFTYRYEDKFIKAEGKQKQQEGWRSQPCSDNCWFLCAQDNSGPEASFGTGDNPATLSSVFKAVKHFLLKKTAESPETEGDQKKKEQIFLPLLGGGKKGNLHDHEVLRAMLSAIGKFARPSEKNPSRRIRADITVCIGAYRIDAIMADIDAGRFNPGQLLARAGQGKMEFTCIAPIVDHRVDESAQKWKYRKMLMKTNATLNELRKKLGLTEIEDGEKTLLEFGVTDGSVKEISLGGDITDGSRTYRQACQP